MGVLIKLRNRKVEADSYSVNEEATPLASDDSSGATGSITFGVADGRTARDWFAEYGETVELQDGRAGLTSGVIEGVAPVYDGGKVNLSLSSGLDILNAYSVTAEPFSGLLGEAIAYYFSLVGVTGDDFQVHEDLALRPVAIVGWSGELWYQLKLLSAAHDAEISLVGKQILVRPVRTRVAIKGRDKSRSATLGEASLALNVEVYHYETRVIHNEPIFPTSGWTDEVSIISVSAGETIEQTLELGASVTSIAQPAFREFVSPTETHESVFTVVGDDGLPITTAAWTSSGGSVTVSIGEDTTTAVLRFTAPASLPSTSGGSIRTYSLALASNSSGDFYSTLRLIGSGVAFTKTKHTFPTGVTEDRTATDTGITVDNPHLTDIAAVYRAGARAAKRFCGRQVGLTGAVIAINEIGDRGGIKLPTYGEVKALLGSVPYATAATNPMLAGKTYSQVQKYWRASVENDYENQAFGNVAGARLWDESSRRWFRIRAASIGPDGINFTRADSDNTHADVQNILTGRTYDEVQAETLSASYAQVTLMGLPE